MYTVPDTPGSPDSPHTPGSPDTPGHAPDASLLRPLRPEDPDRVGGFTLLGRLGEGGMGAVYLARSDGGRVVALKAVHERLAREPEFRVRFRLEAEAARTIGARHGATVVDADTQGTLPWLATEYVLGPSLAEAVERYGPLPEPAVRALGARLARALADIHGSGLVHRDLKPSNVLVTATGPRVIDFGIARALGAGRLTRTGQVLGTPAYMSPEQAMGREHEPSGDVFALAAVLVFAAAGHGPFSGAGNAEVLHRVRHGEPELAGVPDALLPTLARCLAKDPAERPDAAGLAAELDDGNGDFAGLLPGPLLADLGRRAAGVWELRPSRLPGPERTEVPPARGLSRRRLLLGGAGGVLALGAAGAVWAVNGSGGSSGTPRSAASSRAPGLAPEPIWTHDTKAEATLEAFRGSTLVVSVGDEKQKRSAIGIEAKSGTVIWRQPEHLAFETAGAVGAAGTDADGLLVRDWSPWGDEADLFRLDPATGKLARFPGELKKPRLRGFRVVAATTDTVYLQGDTSDHAAVAAYAVDSGERRWLRRSGDGDTLSPGAVEGDVLLLTTLTDIVAMGCDDGRERWRVRAVAKDTPRLDAVHSEAIGNGVVHVGGSEVRAVDIATGKVRWRYRVYRESATAALRPYYGTPAVRGETVYVFAGGVRSKQNPEGNGTELLALRAADGKLLWRYHVDGAVRDTPPPRFHGSRLYADTGAVPQPFLAVDLKTRRPPWTYRSGIPDDGRLTVTGDFSRTSMILSDRRLHLSVGTRVLTLPL
ncbi:protein kinase domain-containing protein [Actinomycetota bacterium Odt1-20B]